MSDKNMALTKIQKIDNNYFIEIPQNVLDELNLKENDNVSVTVEDGTIVIKKIDLISLCKILPTDYEFYGGEIVRDQYPTFEYGSCHECSYFMKLEQEEFGICTKINSPRVGLLTHKYQAGFNCCEK